MSPSFPDDYCPDVDAIYEERHLNPASMEELNSSRYEDFYGPYDGGYDDDCPPDDWEDEDEDYEEEDDR
jgi:hypothetical protein